MATFYIQLQDKLLKVNGDVTKENITNALGYVPSDFYGDFDELSNNPIITDETGVFNIVDETGNIIAKFDNKGIHTVEVSASGHNLTEKADKIYVDNEIRSINFDNLQNNPFYNDNIGDLKITDESGNTITVINSNGVESIEFTALESDGTTHHLTDKINKEDVHTILNNLDTSVKGTSSYVNVTVSQKNGLIDNVEVNDAVLSNTLVIEESGEFTIADEKGNIGLKLDNRGLISNEFIANGHMLSKKADTQYVDDKILTLDSQVSGTSVMHGITINVEEKNGLLSNVVIDDNNINFNKLKDNPIIEGETYGEFTIVDDTSLNSIGFVLNSSGAKAKDFITSTKVSLTDVGARIEQYSKIHDNLSGNILTIDERLSDIETLLQEDGDDVINNLKEVVDYFKDVKETETGAALLTTVATHTTNIEGLSGTVSTLNSKAVLKEGAQTITGRKTFTVGPNFAATGDTNAIAIGYDTRFNLLSGDTITDDTILGMISNKATLGHENYETQVRGKKISVGSNNSKTTIQGSDTKLTYNGKNLAFEEDTASKLKTLKFTYGISAGKTGSITYDGTNEAELYIPTSIGHLNSNDTKTFKSEIFESAVTFTTSQGYATQTWVNNKGYLTSSSLNGYAKTSDVNKKQDAISDLTTIRNNASSGATAYGWGDHSKKGYLTSSSLNGYAKTSDVNKKQDAISDLATIRSNASSGATAYGWGDHSKKGYLTSSALSGYAKEDWVTSYVVSAVTGGQVSLDGYATENWVNSKNYLTSSSLSGYAKTSDVNKKQDTISDLATIRSNASSGATAYRWGDHSKKGYLTSSSLNGYAKTTDVNKKQDAISDLATIRSNASSGATAYGWGDHSKKGYLTSSSLNGYATETWVTKYVTSAVTGGQVSLDGYATEEWVTSKGYLTEHQDISNLATKSEVEALTADVVESEYVMATALNKIIVSAGFNVNGISTLPSGETLTTAIKRLDNACATAYGWGDHSKKGYLTSSSLNGYAKTTDVNKKQDAISDLATIRSNASSGATAYGWGDHSKKGYLTSSSLNGYATETWVTKYVTSAVTGGQVSLDGYATEEWVTSKGYLTEHQDISNLATKSEVEALTADVVENEYAMSTALNQIIVSAGFDTNGISTLPSGETLTNAIKRLDNACANATEGLKYSTERVAYVTTFTYVSEDGGSENYEITTEQRNYNIETHRKAFNGEICTLNVSGMIYNYIYTMGNITNGSVIFATTDLLKRHIQIQANGNCLSFAEEIQVNLEGYATEDWVTEYVVSAVTGGQVSLEGYATENWVNNKGYLTSSSLDGYAKTTDVNKKQDAISDLATIRNKANSGATAYGWGDHSKKGYLTSSSLNGYAKTSDLASYLSKSGGQINGSLIINDESHNHITLTDDGEMYYDAKISYSDGTLGVYSGNRIDILSPISVKSKITVSNEYSGFTCTNLNADLLDGKHASEFMLKTDSVTGSVTYDDITDAPLIDNNDGEFHLVDENDYKIASFNNGGLFTTKVTAINGFFQNSDETLKEFKNDIEIDFERLKNIPKVYYTWKDDTEGNLQIGTSAQKVQEIYPELTSRDADSGKLALDYAKLSIIALKAIDTLHEENKLLRKELEELKEKVNTKRTRKKKTE